MKTFNYILAFLMLSYGAFAQDFSSSQEMPCSAEARNFAVGEKLTYTVFYNWGLLWIAAGEVTFEVKLEGDEFHYLCYGYTFPKYDKIFKVRDYYESRTDTTTLLPNHFKREVEEGKYVRFDSIAFNQSNYTIKEYFGGSRSSAKEHNFTLNHCAHDMLSIIYSLRTFDVTALDSGDKMPMDVFFDKELFTLDLKYSGLERKKIKNLGKYDVRIFSPTLITGNVFTEEAVMNIYISDDKNKIPLLIESPVSVGAVKAVLSGYEGLKYPFAQSF